MTVIKDFINIFYPKVCVNCDSILMSNKNFICTICRHKLVPHNILNFSKNIIINNFYGRVIIEKSYSHLIYKKKGITQRLIHELKYNGNQDIGVFFGNWIGELLRNNKEFAEIDYIIPVPLHEKKLNQRGYNQVTKLGKRLSFYLCKPFIENVLTRIRNTKSQTIKSVLERLNSIKGAFLLKDKIKFNNKHVLLIDDILTTGSTVEECVKELQKSKNTKVSILVIAHSDSLL